MKIGVIGAGRVGTALAKRLVPTGVEMMLSFARDSAKLERDSATYQTAFGSAAEAVAFADVVALTVPWVNIDEALAACGSLAGKIVWDCTNALKPDLSGLAVGLTTSGAEQIAAKAPGARIVKGIPPFAELMHSDDPTVGGKPVGVFMCGDDAQAKAVVRPLLEALPTDVVDAGGLDRARFIEPAAFLLIPLGYAQGFGPRIGLNFLRL